MLMYILMLMLILMIMLMLMLMLMLLDVDEFMLTLDVYVDAEDHTVNAYAHTCTA